MSGKPPDQHVEAAHAEPSQFNSPGIFFCSEQIVVHLRHLEGHPVGTLLKGTLWTLTGTVKVAGGTHRGTPNSALQRGS